MHAASNSLIKRAEFRVATPEEVRQYTGGTIWKCIQAPWNITCKVMGTFEMYRKGANLLAWNTPYPQTLIERFSHWLGFNEEVNFMTKLFSFLGDRYYLHDKVIMDAFFKHHRNDELFISSTSFNFFLDTLKTIFPEEEFLDESFLLTCLPENTKIYRAILHKLLKPSSLNNFQNTIQNSVEKSLQNWEYLCAEYGFVNVTHQTSMFASSIITQLMFDSDAASQDLADSINFIDTYFIKRLAHQLTPADEEQIVRVYSLFKQAIESVLEKEEIIPLFQGETLTTAQKKAIILGVFFAGQKTTAALLNFMIWQIARDPRSQEDMHSVLTALSIEERTSIMQDFFSASIKEFTPAYGVSRKVKQPVCLEYKLEGKEETYKTVFYKDQIITARIASLAQKATDASNYNEWLPFGKGPHSCPGRHLAIQEIITFLTYLSLNYKISTKQKDDIPRVGRITLELAEDVYISLKRR